MHTYRPVFSLWLLAALFLMSLAANAEKTDVTVRVLAKDAKFIGSGMGGALVSIRKLDSGELLVSGLTQGGTGDTGRIMQAPRVRGEALSTESAASFSATLDIASPTRVEISAEGPQGFPASANRVSITQWLLPGKHLTGGDGVLLELPGFVVAKLLPQGSGPFSAGSEVPVRVKIVMMCGCPISPGGMWDADRLQVEASVSVNGKPGQRFAMAYAGQTSEFSVGVPVETAGDYSVTVTVYDPETGNTGLERMAFKVAAR